MRFLSDIYKVWSFEFRNILRDSGVILFALIVPLAYPLLYAFIYNNETIREVPVAVVDEADSQLSRRFVRMLDATADVKVAARALSMEEAEELNRTGKTYGTIRIPAEFDKQLARGEQTTIGVYADMAGMLYYKALMLSSTNVSLELNKEIKAERFYTGATDRQLEIAAQPVEYFDVALFNPKGGFAAFLLPAVLMLILQQTLMLSIGMTGGETRERYAGRVLPPRPEFDNTLAVLLGKTLIYFPLYMIEALYMFYFVSDLFTLPMLGSVVDYVLFMIPYILSCIFMAITFSSFIFRREDCIMLYVFMSLPLLFISGISWPGTAVPEFWKVVSWIFPSTFALNGYVRIHSMGATLSQVEPEFIGLWVQTIVYMVFAAIFYHKVARKAESERLATEDK
ncbi:MAG: ABC transporter permease [Muribaculaceae bacterium]|nr:ABC transporter permease [Muribaculaceae bacterium]